LAFFLATTTRITPEEIKNVAIGTTMFFKETVRSGLEKKKVEIAMTANIMAVMAIGAKNLLEILKSFFNIESIPYADKTVIANPKMKIILDGNPEDRIGILNHTPPVYDYVWQFDFWQYGQNKYASLPLNWQMSIPLLGIGSQALSPKPDVSLFYLIIEPNNDRPWEPDGWKKSFIKVGKVLESKTFPGNVVVEKRNTQSQ
jgi:hypothetical protein